MEGYEGYILGALVLLLLGWLCYVAVTGGPQ